MQSRISILLCSAVLIILFQNCGNGGGQRLGADNSLVDSSMGNSVIGSQENPSEFDFSNLNTSLIFTNIRILTEEKDQLVEQGFERVGTSAILITGGAFGSLIETTLDEFIEMSESEVRDSFQEFLDDKYSDSSFNGLFLVVLQAEINPLIAARRSVSEEQLQMYAEACQLRFKILRENFPKSKISLSSVTQFSRAVNSTDEADLLETEGRINDFIRLGNLGLYEGLDFVTPLVYIRQGLDNFDNDSEALLEYLISYSSEFLRLTEKTLYDSNIKMTKIPKIAPLFSPIILSGEFSTLDRTPISEEMWKEWMATFKSEIQTRRTLDRYGPLIIHGFHGLEWTKSNFDTDMFNYLDF